MNPEDRKAIEMALALADDLLEDIELHGLHDDPSWGYRQQKEEYKRLRALIDERLQADACHCHKCHEHDQPYLMSTFIVCPKCGNKRCPKAHNHRYECTDSNEPGQVERLQADDSEFGPVNLNDVEPDRLQADEKVVYPEGDVVGPCICGSWPGGKCCKCPKADEKEEPVAWRHFDQHEGRWQYWGPNDTISISIMKNSELQPLYDHGKRAEKEEPVAWMRAEGPDGISTMAYCITDKVRQIWLNANPKQVERYTIPLYAHGRKGNGL